MKFRRAQPGDSSSLAALSIEVWIGTYLRNGVSGFFADYALSEFTSAKFEEIIEDENNIIIVSDNENGIDGFVRIAFNCPSPSSRSETEIKTLYVQPRHHGKGIGKGLLRQAYAACAAKECMSVWLAVNSENTAALGFYRANGFVCDGQTLFRIADQTYLNEIMIRQLA